MKTSVIDNKLILNYVGRFFLVFKLTSYLIGYKGVVNFLYKLVYYTWVEILRKFQELEFNS